MQGPETYRLAVRLGIELAWAKCLELAETMRFEHESPEADGAETCAMALKKLRDDCLDDDELEEARRKMLPFLAYKPRA